MNTKEAIEIIKRHNDWRKGVDIEQLPPIKVGDAIDIEFLKKEKRKLNSEIKKLS